jgi:hypothetical protein
LVQLAGGGRSGRWHGDQQRDADCCRPGDTVSSLSGLAFVGAVTPGSDHIWLQAYNGVWSNSSQVTITEPGLPPPVVTATNTDGGSTVGSGATLELTAADNATVTFAAATGMLKLDQPSSFSGEIFGFTGDGTLAGSDQIDLKGINFNTVHDGNANGVLTVTDGTHSAGLNFNGTYVIANFKLADDGNGGTIVYDPPAPGPSQGGTGAHVATDSSNDAFVFHPELGLFAGNQQAAAAPTHNEPGEFAGATLATVHEARENVVFGEVPHDVLAVHAAALAQQHHAHLL